MTIHDPLIHPALLDPRQWGDVDLYATAPDITREPLAGDERHTSERRFEVKHLRLELRLDDERETVAGSAVIMLAPLNDGFTHFELDAAEMDITGVTLHGAEPLPLAFEIQPEKLAVELPRGFARDELLTVEIAYSCCPRKGLYFIKPDEAYPNKSRHIWSQGENEDAHWWFPCADVPNQKMSSELLATVRGDCFALSNGELRAVSDNPDGTKTYHWLLEQPHPAYLITLVVGADYECVSENHNGVPVDYYVYRDRREAGLKLFANTRRMIEFFERQFGVAYPYPKYAQVLVEDFLFGAMENTSATTMTDRCLLDERAALELNYDDIVAHELAHQWWGDLVTCRDWTQIWLNESFATYSEYLWREQTQGRDEARFVLFQDFLTYLNEDQTSHRRPIDCRRYRFSEELMDRHAYEKGACVLDMLRWVLGDESFFRSLTHYLNKFRFGTAETNDFKVAIEEATGRNLHWFFAQWLYGAGYPELEVSYEWRREQRMLRVSVRQVQEFEEQTPVFRFPVEIEIVTGAAQRANYRVELEQAEQDFYFPCDSKPHLVVFDKGHRLCKRMRFPKSAQELLYQLQHDDDVLGRVRAARELGVFRSAEVVRALRTVLHGADFHGVRAAAATALGEIGGEDARLALSEAYRASSDPRVRRACVWALGNFKDDDAIEFLRAALEHDASYFVGVAAVRALAHIGGDKTRDILTTALKLSSWQEVIAAAVFHGFARAQEKRAVEAALEHSRYGRHPAVRVAAVGCLGKLGKELHKESAAERIVDHLIELLKDKSIRARVAAIRALGRIGDKRALTPLREAQQRECLDQLKGALLDAIAGLEKK